MAQPPSATTPSGGARDFDNPVEFPVAIQNETNRYNHRQTSNSITSSQTVDPDRMLRSGSKQIISLFVPVSLCMFFVVLVAYSVEFYTKTMHYLVYTPFHTPDADVGTQTWQTVANTAILMVVIVITTFILVLLFKFRCYKFIQGWLILTTVVLLFVISFIFFSELIRSLDIFVDIPTVVLLLWNFGIVGMLAIHWKGPLLLQQAYLIFLSAQIALVFVKYLPKWTCWLVLAALAVWDLIAVLCPGGPLRMLIELATERQQPLFPALLYSTAAAYDDDEEMEAAGQREAPHSTTPSTEPQEVRSGQRVLRSQEVNEEDTRETLCPSGPVLDGEPPVHSNDNASMTVRLLDIQSTSPSNPTQVGVSVPDVVATSNCDAAPSPVPVLERERRGSRGRVRHSAPSGDADDGNGPTVNNRRWLEMQHDIQDREHRGVKLGLGDFVFYSLLVGRAALDGDAITVAACYVAILLGMCITIIVLGITQRALPALPISIGCGIIFYFATSKIISPFLELLAVKRAMF